MIGVISARIGFGIFFLVTFMNCFGGDLRAENAAPLAKAETPSTIATGALSLDLKGEGLGQTATIDSRGLFRLVFSAASNWGANEWYDLVNDPDATNNLLHVQSRAQVSADVDEDALFQEVFYGTVPSDPKLFTKAAANYFPNAPRSFTVLKNDPALIVVRTKAQPIANAVGVLPAVATLTYSIYPDGRVYLISELTALEAIKGGWNHAVLGLGDPTPAWPGVCGDTRGWIRASASQNPYDYLNRAEPYIYAYWNHATTPDPFKQWTKASIFLMPKPDNPIVGTQECHSWAGFKRWRYAYSHLALATGQSITQRYMIQLGAENSSILPNINNPAAAASIKPDWSKMESSEGDAAAPP